MPVKYQKVWDTMNALEMIISKVVSAREMIDVANEALEYNQKERAEKLTMAAYEFLGYFIEEFDEKFKDAWQATVGDLREGDVRKTFSCVKDDNSPDCQKAWNDFWEENYYPEEYKSVDEDEIPSYEEAISAGWEMTGDGFWVPPQKEDKVKKWILPVEMDDPSGEYFITFPEDLLETAKLEEGDSIYWIDNGDGTFTFRKKTNPISMEEC